jgi:LPXTG-motif cell wall-anchored protein
VEVIHFRTKQQTNGAVISVSNNMIWGIIGLIGIFGLVGFLLRKRNKEKKE